MSTPSLGPSEHLSWAELACHDGTPYPSQWRESRAVPLSIEFERIRSTVGKPITIGSAYRTEAYNRTVPGSAKSSQHIQGRALDLYPPTGWTLDKFHAVIREIALDRRSLIYGLGRYLTFVHIDIRPRPSHGQLVAWHGTRTWAEGKKETT